MGLEGFFPGSGGAADIGEGAGKCAGYAYFAAAMITLQVGRHGDPQPAARAAASATRPRSYDTP